jgi:putative ABC transport system ATP-binding protein
MSILSFENVSRIYPGTPPVQALKNVTFKLQRRAFAVLVGPSGSGKTTLLNLASGLDQVSEGRIVLDGDEISKLSHAELCQFRRERLGFVFQAYNLFPALTAVENVEYTSLIRGETRKLAREKAIEALESVGLSDKVHSFPGKLSGGQQQRVAVARALASESKIILADEPTANLDSKSAFHLIDLFEQLNHSHHVSFLFSTHDSRLVDRAHQRIEISDGELIPSPESDHLQARTGAFSLPSADLIEA